MKTIQYFLMVIFLGLFCMNLTAQTNHYVKPAASGLGNGSSWADATTLSSALSASVSGDIIHLAAGTYIPEVLITTGSDDLDMTFEIKNNVTLIGGYPANPGVQDQPAVENKTILSGKIAEGYNAYHVVAVTAPVENGKKVSLSNIAITGGKASATGAALTINTLSFLRVNGSAMIVGGSVVELNDCRIFDNESGNHTPGVYAFSNANVTFNGCTVENNVGTGNGAGLWAASSTVYVNNSSFIGNKCGGVGAIQLITNSKAFFYNSTIANNVAGNGSTTSSRNGSGIYVRDGSDVQVINCTISGNESNGNGAGIALHTSNVTTYPGTKVTVINSTITGNKSKIQTSSTAGIYALTAACTVNIHNSVVSGNTAIGSSNWDAAVLAGSALNKMNSILSDKVYDASGAEVSGQTFDSTTMLGALADNGGVTKTCQLLGTVNPAKTLGMSSAELTTLGGTFTPAIPESLITYDQLGNLRTGRVIGAWSADKTPTGVIQNKDLQKPLVYSRGNSICIETKANDRIAVYAITGQRIHLSNATGSLTKINNLEKGNIYIVKVNGQSTKIVI